MPNHSDREISLADLQTGDILLLQGLKSDGSLSFSHTGIAVAQAAFSHHAACSSNIVHAGIFARDDDRGPQFVEAAGGDTLRVVISRFHEGGGPDGSHEPYKYLVYRVGFVDSSVPMLAAALGKKIAESNEAGQNYAKLECYSALFRTSARGPGYLYRRREAKKVARHIESKLPESGTAQEDVEAIEDLDARDLDKFFGHGFKNNWYCSSFAIFCYDLAVWIRQAQGADIDRVFSVDFKVASPKMLQSEMRRGDSMYTGKAQYVKAMAQPLSAVRKAVSKNHWNCVGFVRGYSERPPKGRYVHA